METPQRHIIDELKKNSAPLPGEDYFASLKAGLLEKANPAEEKTVAVVPLYRRKWLIGLAAAAAIACLLILRNGKQETVSAVVDWNSVTREEMLAYVDENIEEFDAVAIAEQLDSIPEWRTELPATDISAEKLKPAKKQQKLFDQLDDEEILKYLEEEVIELDDELLIGG